MNEHRARELQLLDRYLSAGRAADDRMRAVLVAARPGIGTSTLLDRWAARRVDRGTLLVRLDGRAQPGDDRLLLDEDVLDAAVRDPETAQAGVRSRLEQLTVRSGVGGVIILLDHADELDRSHLALLASVTKAQLAAQVDLIVSITGSTLPDGGRPTLPAGVAELIGALETVVSVPLIEPRPLEGNELRAVVRELIPDGSEVQLDHAVNHSGGVLSLVRAARDDPSSGAWIDRQLARLGDHADAARLAALVPRGIPFGCGIDIDSDAFARTPIADIVDDPTGASLLRIPSSAIRASVGAAMTAAERRAVLAHAIELVEATTAEPTDALQSSRRYDLLARLHRARGDHRSAVRHFTTAAELLDRGGRPFDACAAALEAIEDARRGHPREHLDATRSALTLLRELNDSGVARDLVRSVRRLAVALGDRELEVFAAVEQFWMDYDPVSRAAMKDAAERGPETGWALRAQAWFATSAGDDLKVEKYARQALAHPQAMVDTALRLQSLEMEAMAAEVTHGTDTAIQLLEAGIEAAREAGSWRRVALMATNLIGVLIRDGRPKDAAEVGERFLPIIRDVGRRALIGDLSSMMAFASLYAGDIPRTRALVAETRATLVDDGSMSYARAVAACVATREAFESGDASRTEAELAAAIDIVTEHDEIYVTVDLTKARIRILAAAGDLHGAAHLAVEGFVDVDASERAEALVALARAAWMANDTHAIAVARQLRIELGNEQSNAFFVTAACAEVSADSRRPLLDQAQAQTWRVAGFDLEALELSVSCAAHDETSDSEALRTLRLAARQLGAVRLEAVVNGLLKAQGHRAPASSRPRGDALLTERELQVAKLVREGLTNREIGSDLGIAPATVARILANIYKRHSLSTRLGLVNLINKLES